MAYDLFGRMTSRTDVDGATVSMEYDHMDQVTKVSDAVGDIEYAYNADNMTTKVTDAEGRETSYAYDHLYRLTQVSDQAGKHQWYTYDNAGRVTDVAAGSTGTVDPFEAFFDTTTGQLSKMRYTNIGSKDVDYYYDSVGRMTQVDDWFYDWTDANGNDGQFFEYDGAGRLTRLRDHDDDPSGTRKCLDYAYDALGRTTSMTDYDGYSTSYTRPVLS